MILHIVEIANHREKRHLEMSRMLPQAVSVRNLHGRGRYKTFGGYDFEDARAV